MSPQPPRQQGARFAPPVASSPTGGSPYQGGMTASYISGIESSQTRSMTSPRGSPTSGSRGPPMSSATYGAYPYSQQRRNLSSRMATKASSVTRSIPYSPVGPLYSSAPGALGRSPRSPVPTPNRKLLSAGEFGNQFDVVPLRRPCDICTTPPTYSYVDANADGGALCACT